MGCLRRSWCQKVETGYSEPFCCGNEALEFPFDGNSLCCESSSSCTFDGACYNPGDRHTTNHYLTCQDNIFKNLNLDTNLNFCIDLYGNGFSDSDDAWIKAGQEYGVGQYFNINTFACCGDDVYDSSIGSYNEYIVPNYVSSGLTKNGFVSCDDSYDCAIDGECCDLDSTATIYICTINGWNLN